MADFILKIKEEYRSTVVGYNNSGLPLGERDDLHLLAEMARYDPTLAKLFEEMPTEEQITEIKEEVFLEAHPIVVPEEEPSTNTVPTVNTEEHGSDAE